MGCKMATEWRNTRDYRIWHARVIRRDKQCVVCRSSKKRTAHHLNSGSYFKEERFDTSNGVCLCSECHTNFHTNFKRSYRETCTGYDFDNFITLSRYFIDKASK